MIRSRTRIRGQGLTGGGGTPPVNTVAPTISGDPFVGSTLTINNGTWTGADSYSYQATRDGVDIGGATTQTYVVATADIGTDVGGKVTATNGSGSTGPVSTSNVIDIVDPSTIANGLFFLDASSPSYYTKNGSNDVYEINDYSPANNDVISVDPPIALGTIYGVKEGITTLNGRPCYSFDAISTTGAHIDMVAGLNAIPNDGSNWTWVMTFAARDTTNEQRIICGDTGTGSRHVILFDPANNRMGFQSKSTFSPTYITITPDTNVHSVWMRRTGAVLDCGYDALTATGAAANTGAIVNIEIGRKPTNINFFKGEIAFAGLWSRALTDPEIAYLL